MINIKYEPIETTLGTIYLKNWVIGIIARMVSIKKNLSTEHEFMTNFVNNVVVLKDGELILPFDKTSSLTSDDFDQIAKKYIEWQKKSFISHVENKEEWLKQKQDETNCQQLQRLVMEDLNYWDKEFEKMGSSMMPLFKGMQDAAKNLSGLFKPFTISEDVQKALADNKKSFIDLGNKINTISIPKQTNFKELTRIPLIDAKLEVLVEIRNILSRSSAIVDLQREQLSLLYDSTEKLFLSSTESSGQAKKSINLASVSLWIAVVGIVVSSIITIWTDVDSDKSYNKISTIMVKQLEIDLKNQEYLRMISSKTTVIEAKPIAQEQIQKLIRIKSK